MFRLKVSHGGQSSIEQHVAQCQHPADVIHIHAVKQFRPQGKKNDGQNNEIRYNKNCRNALPTIPCNNPESDTGWKIHQIEKKLDVPQHQP